MTLRWFIQKQPSIFLTAIKRCYNNIWIIIFLFVCFQEVRIFNRNWNSRFSLINNLIRKFQRLTSVQCDIVQNKQSSIIIKSTNVSRCKVSWFFSKRNYCILIISFKFPRSNNTIKIRCFNIIFQSNNARCNFYFISTKEGSII